MKAKERERDKKKIGEKLTNRRTSLKKYKKKGQEGKTKIRLTD